MLMLKGCSFFLLKKKGHFRGPTQLDTLEVLPQIAVSMLLLSLSFIDHGSHIEELLFCEGSKIYLIPLWKNGKLFLNILQKPLTLPAYFISSLNLITDCYSMRHSDITLLFTYLEGFVRS